MTNIKNLIRNLETEEKEESFLDSVNQRLQQVKKFINILENIESIKEQVNAEYTSLQTLSQIYTDHKYNLEEVEALAVYASANQPKKAKKRQEKKKQTEQTEQTEDSTPSLSDFSSPPPSGGEVFYDSNDLDNNTSFPSETLEIMTNFISNAFKGGIEYTA
ncbi:MAG: hypothetical protein CV045_11755 [Cyanobacteria bacterium M5B4]|nr:MAG: hypothetical protein CV045_11755 [Cyanobacteria bacterium M5B4]